MKMFTLFIMILLLSYPVFSGGQSDDSMDSMESKDTMESEGSMEKEDSMESKDSMDKMEAPHMMAPSPIMDFQGMEDAMMLAESKPTVLFFNASWCPSCQAAMKELNAAPEKLTGINLLLVDYDNSDDLQKKYGVTYQHTFVHINPDGSAIKTWNGGGN